MKKNIFYLILLLFFTFIFAVFYKGLDKPNFYTPKEVNNKNFEEFTSFELFSNKQFDSQDLSCGQCVELHKVDPQVPNDYCLHLKLSFDVFREV